MSAENGGKSHGGNNRRAKTMQLQAKGRGDGGGLMTGAKVPLTKEQLNSPEQIDRLVERFTQTYNYKAVAEMDRQFNCHAIEDAIKESHQALLEMMRRQHRVAKEKALAQRQQLLTELSTFRASIGKLIREEVPRLVDLHRAKGGIPSEPSVPTQGLPRQRASGETLYGSLLNLPSKTNIQGVKACEAGVSPEQPPKGN